MKPLTIASESGKGRAFQAALVAHVRADALWEGGGAKDSTRPVLLVAAASDAELGSFTANLRCGRKAITGDPESRRDHGERFELLKSAGYHFTTQRTPHGSVLTAYLRPLFVLDPGMVDPAGVRFVALPSEAWVAAQARALGPAAVAAALAHLRAAQLAPEGLDLEPLVPLASLAAAYLDRRVRAPLVPDLAFQLRLFVALLSEGLATLSTEDRGYSFRERPWGQHGGFGYQEHGLAAAGFAPGVAVRAKHDELEKLLADQVAGFFASPRRTRRAA